MDVTVASGGEKHVIAPDDEVAFHDRGLTVKVLASVAVRGSVANVLPQPFRLELLAWRTGERAAQ